MSKLTVKHKPYSVYKATGVEWIGHIPLHWKVKRLKFSARIEAGQSPPSETVSDNTNTLPFLQGNAEFGPVNPIPKFGCETAPKRCQPGDILLSVRAPVGAINIADQAFGIGRGLCAVQPCSDLQGLFSYYLLLTVRLQLNEVAAGSTYDAVTIGDVGSMWTILPPSPEQRAIAAFLDRETAKIDALVSKEERLIELLQEKRTALISHTVAKGLDPNAPMKDSGVEWLGEIPAHWNVQRLRYLANIKTGDRDTVDRQDDGKYPFFVRSQTVERINSWSFDGEAVLTAGDGGVGEVFHYINGKFDYHQRVYKFSDFSSVTGKYFFHYFRSTLRFRVSQGTAKSTVDSLRLPMLQDFPVVVPSPAEQRAIVAFLDQETAKLDNLIAKVQKAIELLKELRIALISAAVTGKIDVREEA